MLQMLHSTIQPLYNGIAFVCIVAHELSLCIQSGSYACDLVIHSYHIIIRCIVNLSFTFAVKR